MKTRAWRRHNNAADVAVRFVDGDGTSYARQFVQDVEPAINHNTDVRNDSGGWLPDRSARRVGSIPVTIVWDKIREWQAKGELPERIDPAFSPMLNEKLKELLRDRDYAKFRTAENI